MTQSTRTSGFGWPVRSPKRAWFSPPAEPEPISHLLGETKRVPVAFKGVVPDLFKAGSEVVVEGRLDQGGVFRADSVMTKCASKYESGEHGHKQQKQEKTS